MHAQTTTRDVSELDAKLHELEHTRESQSGRIAELQTTVRELRKHQDSNTQHSYEELRVTKATLSDITKRSKQVR